MIEASLQTAPFPPTKLGISVHVSLSNLFEILLALVGELRYLDGRKSDRLPHEVIQTGCDGYEEREDAGGDHPVSGDVLP